MATADMKSFLHGLYSPISCSQSLLFDGHFARARLDAQSVRGCFYAHFATGCFEAISPEVGLVGILSRVV